MAKVSVLYLELFYLLDIVLICEIVIVMYAQSAAKNARHESADTMTDISALSRVVIRVFEHTHGHQFRAIPSAMAMLQAHQFALLPPSNIISVLSTGLQALNYSGFDLSPTDMTLFNDLCQGNAIVQLRLTMKAFRKQEKK